MQWHESAEDWCSSDCDIVTVDFDRRNDDILQLCSAMMTAGRCSGTSLQRTGARLTVVLQLLTLTEEMMTSRNCALP